MNNKIGLLRKIIIITVAVVLISGLLTGYVYGKQKEMSKTMHERQVNNILKVKIEKQEQASLDVNEEKKKEVKEFRDELAETKKETSEEIARKIINGQFDKNKLNRLEHLGYDIEEIEDWIVWLTPKPKPQPKSYSYSAVAYNCVDVPASAVGQAIANDAQSYVGWLPYVFAGADLNSGVDCSGFTMALYARYGYYLSHSTWDQACSGISVPLSAIAPGDIVCYGGHVAIYIGGGLIAHAPVPGRCVEIASIYIMGIIDVRRIAY